MSEPRNPRQEIDALPGLKERELRRLGEEPCPFCRKPVIRPDYPPMFFRLRIERLAMDATAVRRRAGLGMLLGSGALAQAMGPDEDLAKIVTGPNEIFVCEPCMLERAGPLYVVALEEEPAEGDEPE